jgi:hypothetical protein
VTAPTQTIPRGEAGETSVLSFAQERLFLLDRIMPGLPAYNVPRVVRVGASLDAAALEEAFRLVVERVAELTGADAAWLLRPAATTGAEVEVRTGKEPDDDGALLQHPAESHGRPGSRAPHVAIGDGSTLDLFGRGFVLLRAGADEGRAVVMVTHEAAATELADRVLRLKRGRLEPC